MSELVDEMKFRGFSLVNKYGEVLVFTKHPRIQNGVISVVDDGSMPASKLAELAVIEFSRGELQP